MSNYVINNGELYHYGVPGMKWGVRKAELRKGYKKAKNDAFSRYEKTIADIEKPYKRGQMLSEKDQAREARADARYQKDVASAKAVYKKGKADLKAERKAAKEKAQEERKNPAKNLSDQELRARLNRLNMEKQYKQLTQKEKSAGIKFVTGIALTTVSGLATAYATKYAKQGIDALIKKAADAAKGG